MNDTLLDLEWSAPQKSELIVSAILSFGDDDEMVAKLLRFTDDEQGIGRARVAMKALPHLVKFLEESSWSLSVDDDEVFEALSKDLEVPARELKSLLGSVLCLDLKYEQYAHIVAMTVTHHSPTGIRRAILNSGGARVSPYVKKFDATDPRYLKDWA